MSTFNRFLGKVGRSFKKVGDKVEGIGDSAADSVRAKTLQIRIEEQYELLGEVVYRSQHTEEDLGEKVMELMATIDGLFDELETIKAKKAARKAAKEAAKEAAEEAAAEEAVAEEVAAEEAPVEEAAEESATEEAAPAEVDADEPAAEEAEKAE